MKLCQPFRLRYFARQLEQIVKHLLYLKSVDLWCLAYCYQQGSGENTELILKDTAKDQNRKPSQDKFVSGK